MALNARPPSVSLGLPVHNGGPLFVQALESILAQSFGEFELIVSDNASTDATADILRAYAARDRRIRAFRQPRNIGGANNWDFVARQARGTWLLGVSANDEYARTLLQDCLEPLRSDSSVVLCYGRTQLIDLAGQRLALHEGDFEALSDDPIERYRTVRSRLHLGTPLQAGVVRLDALRRCGFMGNYRDSDRVLIAALALLGKFVLLPQVVLYRRWHATVATPLRTPLEVARFYRPGARRPPLFPTLPRMLGQLQVPLRVPADARTKGRAMVAALGCTDWRRKLLGDTPFIERERALGGEPNERVRRSLDATAPCSVRPASSDVL